MSKNSIGTVILGLIFVALVVSTITTALTNTGIASWLILLLVTILFGALFASVVMRRSKR